MAADEANPDRCFRMFEIHKLEGIEHWSGEVRSVAAQDKKPNILFTMGDDIACRKSARTTARDRPKVQ